MLNTVYLKIAWCLVNTILHQSIVVQGKSMIIGALFYSLLAELSIILDNFFINTTSDYIGLVGWECWRAIYKVAGKTHAV